MFLKSKKAHLMKIALSTISKLRKP